MQTFSAPSYFDSLADVKIQGKEIVPLCSKFTGEEFFQFIMI